ncbi:MAG: hypothetical protein PHF57_08875 [Methanoregula sp.]|nr:hypothetical protein [Methanoregula sp.]
MPSVDRCAYDVLAIAARYRSRFREKTDVAVFRRAIAHPARPGTIRFSGDERAALCSANKTGYTTQSLSIAANGMGMNTGYR